MPLRRMSEILANVSPLLVQANSADPAERADAMTQLKVIRDKLGADVAVLEAATKGGRTRRVELAAIRAALTTLTDELAVLESDESFRSQPLA